MEARLFPEGTVPDYTTAAWYADRDSAPHVEEYLHQGRMAISRHYVHQCLVDPPLNGHHHRLIDLGAGDGGFLTLLAGLPVDAEGVDLQPTNVAAAERRGVKVRYGDLLAESVFGYDIVVATEVIEHLRDPHAFLAELAGDGVPNIIASSPYTETAEDHYGYHAWAWDLEGYRALFDQAGYDLAEQQTTSMFQVVRARLR